MESQCFKRKHILTNILDKTYFFLASLHFSTFLCSLNWYAGLHGPYELSPIAQPVDYIEYEKQEGHGNQEKSVCVNKIFTTPLFSGGFKLEHFASVHPIIWGHLILEIVFTYNLKQNYEL